MNGSCEQYIVITVFIIHGICECLDEIFSQVTIHDSTQDSVIIDIIPSIFHELLEFYFCDTLCVFFIIILGKILRHNIRRVLFAPNILNVHVFVFHHVSQKMVTYIVIFGTHTNLPILF